MGKRHAIGLVGCGNWGRYILRDLVSLGCQVTVVARSEGSRRNALQGGAAAVVASIAELPPVDGVVVATTTSTHAAVLDELVPMDVPLFVEKPLTNDPASADRLASQAADRLFVMDKWRYHPGIEALSQIARSGELGPVVGLKTMRVGWGNPHPDTDAVWILAPHDLSIALEILGEIPTPRSAVADRDGPTATGLFAILGEDPWFALEVSGRYRERRRDVRLLCRDGVAVLPDGYSDCIQLVRGPASDGDEAMVVEEERPISKELPLLRELRTFTEFLDGGPPPRSNAAEGAAIVRTVARLRALAGLDLPAAP